MRRRRNFSKYATSFTKPIRTSGPGKKQVGITPRIQRYANSFKAKGLRGIDLANAIIKDIHGFKKVLLEDSQAKKVWGKITADSVIKARTVYINKNLAIFGCTDRAFAIVSTLRAAGFKTVIARSSEHTIVKVLYGKKLWIANTLPTRRKAIREMSERDMLREDRHRNANAYAEGASFSQIGLNNFGDFSKYAEQTKKALIKNDFFS